MPSLSSINRANYQRDVQSFPKILKERLLANLVLLVIPNFITDVYYEGGDRGFKEWSWYHIATFYFLNSLKDYFQVPLILDSISFFLWQRGLRTPVVMIRILTMLAMAHLWYCVNDFQDSMFNSHYLAWWWTYLTALTLLPLGLRLDAFSKLNTDRLNKRGLGKGRGKYVVGVWLLSMILLVWSSVREILLFRRLKLFERMSDLWSFSSARRKVGNFCSKIKICIRYMSGKMSESLWNWWNNINPKTAFLEACESGNKVEMRALLSEHEDSLNVNLVRNSNGDTGLHLAARSGHAVIAESLLDVRKKVVNVNIENAAGETPLMVAAGAGHLAIVRRLLKAKGLKLKEYGERALLEGVRNGHYECTKLILEAIVRKVENDVDTRLRNMQDKLESCLQISKRIGDSKTEQDLQQCNLSLDLYKKSMCEIISPSHDSNQRKATKQKPMKESIQDLKEYLDCSICFEEFEDLKIFACVNDHWICMRCLPQNESCPFCRVDFSLYPPARRITSEKILQILSMTQCDT